MHQSIAIIGAGPVGRALSHGFTSAGHTVSSGVRQPADAKHDDIRQVVDVQTVAEAVDGANVVVLAVPADSLTSLVPSLRLTDSQVLVDATNAVFSPVPDGFDTVADCVASLIPTTVSMVKAFNTVGAEHLTGHNAALATFLPIAGDEPGIAVVAPLARDLGFEVADLGGRDAFELVEDHARLWIHLAIKRGWGRDFALSVVRR